VCDNADDADVLIVNTCTVKSSAERRIMDYIKEKSAEGKRIVATGCIAGSYPERISRLVPGASIITAPNIEKIGYVVRESSEGRAAHIRDYSKVDRAGLLGQHSFGNVIEQIPISDGCLSSCGFCATRFSRGPLNSFSKNR
jgi:2-methylthioadenine synthetase